MATYTINESTARLSHEMRSWSDYHAGSATPPTELPAGGVSFVPIRKLFFQGAFRSRGSPHFYARTNPASS